VKQPSAFCQRPQRLAMSERAGWLASKPPLAHQLFMSNAGAAWQQNRNKMSSIIRKLKVLVMNVRMNCLANSKWYSQKIMTGMTSFLHTCESPLCWQQHLLCFVLCLVTMKWWTPSQSARWKPSLILLLTLLSLILYLRATKVEHISKYCFSSK
jgi:hypothetical protein